MTAAERDAAVAALEKVYAKFKRAFMSSEDDTAWQYSAAMVVWEEVARLRRTPVKRDELKDALLWHWAAIERLRRLGPYGVLFRDQKPEFHWATIMRDDAAERVRELMEVADGDDR